MDWTAVGSVAAVAGIVGGFYWAVLRSRVAMHTEPINGADGCELVIINNGATSVYLSRIEALWPFGSMLALPVRDPAREPWDPGPSVPGAPAKQIAPDLTVVPGSSARVGFYFLPSRSRRSSCCIWVHIDESRTTQISRIRVVPIVASAVTIGK